MRKVVKAIATIIALMTSVSAHASSYPEMPVTIVVPYAPGGITDIVGRSVADRMSKALSQSVVVENRSGASGAIGATFVSRAKPDGYTLFVGTVTTQATNPSTQANLSYDPIKSFTPIVMLAAGPCMMIVNNQFPVKSVDELVTYAKTHPGEINYASPGTGGLVHLSTELFAMLTDTKLVHVPYKGSTPALTDLMGGSVQIMLDNMPSAVAAVQSGRARPLAITSSKRSDLVPDVPTFKEAGFPDIDPVSWIALYAPAGTPKHIVDIVNQAVNESLKDPRVLEVFRKSGVNAGGGSPSELATYQAADSARWARVTKNIGFEPQ